MRSNPLPALRSLDPDNVPHAAGSAGELQSGLGEPHESGRGRAVY